jgi:hypothetical protein
VELELHVSGQMSRGTRDRPAYFMPRKHDGESYSRLILPALEAELTRRLRAELAEGRGRAEDFVLAMPRTGRPPHQRNLQQAVIDAALSAGLGHVSPQTLRRSFASIAARRIPDPAEAAHMTGHSLDTWVRHLRRSLRSRRASGRAETPPRRWPWSARSRRSADTALTFSGSPSSARRTLLMRSPAAAGLLHIGAPRFELGTSSPPD